MTKLEAMVKVFEGQGKVYAISPSYNGINKITYGAGHSLRWNFSGEFVACDYLDRDGYKIQNVVDKDKQ